MPKVATLGDVTATPALPTAAGAWVAGVVSEVVVPGLTVGGRPVVSQASCAFTFTNSVTGATVVVPVQITASPGGFRIGTANVLLDGASVDVGGNTLRVGTSASTPLVIGA